MGGISQQLIEGISIIVNKAIKTADYARIRTGLITRINSNNTYDVEVDSKNLPEIPFMGTGVLATNSTVKVAFPDNQPNQAMILGVTNSGTPVSGVNSVNGMTGDVVVGLDNLNNVLITTPIDGSILTYNGTRWINTSDINAAQLGGQLPSYYAESSKVNWGVVDNHTELDLPSEYISNITNVFVAGANKFNGLNNCIISTVKFNNDLVTQYIIGIYRNEKLFYRVADTSNHWGEWKTVINNDMIYNPNILDNPWFTINQSNTTTISSSMKLCDRWVIYTYVSGSATMSSDGVILNGSFDFGEQLEPSRLPNRPNLTLTMSALLNDGTIVSKTFTLINDGSQEIFATDTSTTLKVSFIRNWYAGADLFFVTPLNSNVTVRATKLELGTISTIHLDPLPNPQQELAKCQRYFVRFNYAQYSAIGITSSDTNYVMFQLSLATPMRIVPTVTITCTPTRVADFWQLTNVGINSMNNGTIILGSPHSGTPITSTLMAGTSGYIDLSAEL